MRGILNFVVLGLVSLGLAACTIPGIPRTTDRSQEAVTVAGQACTYRSRTTETPTVNGMSRYVENLIDCGGQVYDCGDASAGRCGAAITAGRDPAA